MAEYSQAVNDLYEKMNRDAEEMGYHLNPDLESTMMLMEGLQTNQERFGYVLCPCRLTLGSKEADLDVICPCDYRDADLEDYGCCY